MNHEIKQIIMNNSKDITTRTFGNLSVVKFKKAVYFNDTWNEDLMMLRGLVIDKDYNIVNRPFNKCFNENEKYAPKFDDDEFVYAVRKRNGFMLCVGAYEGQLILSTTGSLHSPFTELAKIHFEKAFTERQMCNLLTYIEDNDCSFVFEVCDSVEDPHIIKEDHEGLYLLGILNNTITQSVSLGVPYEDFGDVRCDPANVMPFRMAQLMAQDCNHEGYMIWSHDSKRVVKLKSNYYLVKKFFMRFKKNLNVLQNPQIKNSREFFEEEYYPLIEEIQRMGQEFLDMSELQRDQFITTFLSTRD